MRKPTIKVKVTIEKGGLPICDILLSTAQKVWSGSKLDYLASAFNNGYKIKPCNEWVQELIGDEYQSPRFIGFFATLTLFLNDSMINYNKRIKAAVRMYNTTDYTLQECFGHYEISNVYKLLDQTKFTIDDYPMFANKNR